MHQGQGKSRRRVPTVWLMTDARIADADLLRAVRRLPRGAAIVVRHYERDAAARRALFDGLRAVVGRRCRLLLAGSPEQARAWGADGHHGPMPTRRTGPWLHSAPAHDYRELVRAIRAGADVLMISPLFATRSHPGTRPLGAARFAALTRRARVPVMALGGVHPRHAGLVRRLGAAGFAAIDGLAGTRCGARACMSAASGCATPPMAGHELTLFPVHLTGAEP